MSVLKVKNGDQWDIVPAIKGDTGDPAADESITDAMLVPDGIKTEIDWLWGNQLMDIREGELLQTNDAYEAPLVSLDVDGNSTQVQTTGKNLFNKEGPKGYWSDTDGSFVNSSLRVWWSVPVSEGDMIRSSATGVWGSQTYLNGVFVEGNIDTRPSSGYVIPSGVDEIRGSIANNGWDTGIVTKNNSDMTYEPYSGGMASPSPDWPQEIVSVDGCEVSMLGNENDLFQTLEWKGGYYSSNGSVTGVTENTVSRYEEEYIPVTAGDVLTYVVMYPRAKRIWARCPFYDADKTRLGNLGVDVPPSGVEPNKMYLFRMPITDSRAAYLRISFDVHPETAGVIHMLTIAPTIVPLLPDGYSLRSLPDGTKDELHLSYLRPSTREGWAWYERELVQRTHDTAFSDLSAKGWAKSGSATNGFYLNCANFEPAMKASVENGVMSDVATAVNSASVWNTTMNAMFVGNSFNIQFDASLVGSTATAFKSWLATSDATLVYPLATPITTQLDPIELPIMPSKDTTIWSDPSAQLKMTYIQDTNLVIESLEATVADMATS